MGIVKCYLNRSSEPAVTTSGGRAFEAGIVLERNVYFIHSFKFNSRLKAHAVEIRIQWKKHINSRN